MNLVPSDVEVALRESALVALDLLKARDAAWFGGRPTAVSLDEGRLRVWRLVDGKSWQPEPRGERDLGEARVTALSIDGELVDPRTRLVFLPDGFGIPFRVALEVRGLGRAIEGDAAGAVAVLER